MKFSTKTTYGLRALTKLGENYERGSLSLAKIAREEKISLGYLEKIFATLKKNEVVESVRGSSGGYTLSHPPQEISVYSLLNILEGDLKAFVCVDNGGKIICGKKDTCGAATVISKIQNAINDSLSKLKLSDLIRKNNSIL